MSLFGQLRRLRATKAWVRISCLVMLLMAPLNATAQPTQIRVAMPLDYLPLSDENILGEPSGLLPEIWRLWSEKTGVEVEFVTGPFAQTVEALREGAVDVHGSLFWNEGREEWLSFTRPFHESSSSVYYPRNKGQIQSLAELSGQTVGVLAATHQEGVLRESELGFSVIPFSNPTEMLRAMFRGDIDFVVHEDLAMDLMLNRTGLIGDVARMTNQIMRNDVFAAVRKDQTELLGLLEWGFSQISKAEYAAIESKWIDHPANRLFLPAGSKVPLSTREREWLADHKVIRVGVQSQWPPMASVESDGEVVGLSVDFIEAMNQRLGGVMTLVPGSWTDLLEAVQEKRLDAVIDISPVPSRMESYRFTDPYVVIPHVFVVREDAEDIDALASLAGKSLAIEEGYQTNEFIRESYPDIRIVTVPDAISALRAVSVGEADAWIGNRAVARYLIDLHEDELSDLLIGGNVEGRSSVLTVGVRHDWDVFRNILNKAITGISSAQYRFITEPWFSGTVADTIELSAAEQRWLTRFRDENIRVLVEDWPPFNYADGDENVGMGLDYVRHAFDKLGLRIEYVRLPWHEALAAIRDRDKIDVIPAMAPSQDRAGFLNFTDQYLAFPDVIFTREDEGIITGLDDLKGRTVAIEKDFILDERLARDYPEITRLRVDSTHDAINAVSVGEATAYVGNLAAGTYHIQKHGYTNLKIAAPTKYEEQDQSMGIRKDWPELASMIDKVLSQMTDAEHNQIQSAALSVRYDHGINIRQILIYAVPALGVFIVILVIIVIANRKLSEREAWFKSLLESAPDATIFVNSDGKIVRANRQAEILFGVNREDLEGSKIEQLVPEEIRDRHVGYRHGFVTASAPREMGANKKLMARRWNGDMFPVEISLSPIETKMGTLIAASIRDITKRREAEEKLAEKDVQLTAALENMSGGMFMIDKDQIIRVFNKKFVELYQLPEVKVGTPMRDIIMIRAGRGDYGPGNVDEQVENRIEGYRDRTPVCIEDSVPGGSIIESYRQPTSDGGMVCIFNDITIRKKAQEALAAQTKQLENLSNKLSKYLSPQIYEAIFAGATDVAVQTERKKLTVFFSDIKNFTATTEEMEPEDMTFLLNDYLTKMTEIALEYGGTIDKYVGDAIMVFFGDPDTQGVKEDALAAVRMAVAMQRRMVDLRAKWADMGFRLPFHIRCGVNTGYCNVGNFGSEQRMDYTIIGGQVNLAARLEGICPPDGVTVSHETYSLVRDEFDADPMEPIQVKGIHEPVEPFVLKDILENWDASERYIRRDDVRGLRVWVDLVRMTEEQRRASIKELEDVLSILKVKKLGPDEAAE